MSERYRVGKITQHGTITRVQIGPYSPKVSNGCNLEKGSMVIVEVDPINNVLQYVASQICAQCPFLNNGCRIGIAP